MHVMKNHLRRLFYIQDVDALIDDFCRRCSPCLHAKGGKIISRPRVDTYRCAKRN
ncbi:TPA: hypothetical protein N0F65_007812 [Lagenidium giganteum]|uniref:Integrase zinc-binding domain-containing protein n=1 Tax=Lagenidium giganteum TaxID=4803 RepID=A0AAV2Z0M5_9STRA|nr:TPA: hypothetical protein N0F65_007812 [Lagenidium giganteum]